MDLKKWLFKNFEDVFLCFLFVENYQSIDIGAKK